MDFKDKVVLVTGSTSGIGQDAAVRYAQQGASVTVHGRNEKRMQETLQLLKEAGIPDSRVCKVLGPIEDKAVQERLIKDTVAKFGRLDILVNNAGMPNRIDLNPNGMDNFDYIFAINTHALISLTRLAAPELFKTKGNVINISSVSGRVTIPNFTPYCVSKAAVDHFTRNAAALYAPKGVRVNAISPGFIVTNISENYGVPMAQVEDFYQPVIQNKIPLRRFGQSEEVTQAILFLSGPHGSYITGANLVIDGGLMINGLLDAGEPKE